MELVTHVEDDGIHVFTFHEKNRKAVDAYIAVFVDLFTVLNAQDEMERENVLRVVVDVHEKGLFPLKYTVERSRQVLTAFEFIPLIYYAYISDDAGDVSLIRSLDHYSPSPRTKEPRRIFPPHQLEEAKAWLRTKPD